MKLDQNQSSTRKIVVFFQLCVQPVTDWVRCDVCDRSFVGKQVPCDCLLREGLEALRSNTKILVEGLEVFACDWPGCIKKFYDKNHLKRHSQNHTDENFYRNSERRAPVKEVENVLTPKARAVSSQKKKTFERIFACEWPGCNKKYSLKYDLKRHSRKHTDEKFQRISEKLFDKLNFVCYWPGCDERFIDKKSMEYHLDRHTDDEKHFSCDWPNCGKTFTHESSLITHRRTHTFLSFQVKI